MFDSPQYSGHTDAVEIANSTETGAPDKADLRIPASAHEMVTRCSAQMKTNDFQPSQCKWFCISSKDKRSCMYDKWGIMCDKVVIQGKGIN